MMERLNAIPIVTAVFPCGEEEIAYTGVMTTALHNILRGHRRKDDDEAVAVRLPQGELLLFDVVNAIKRQVTAGLISFPRTRSMHVPCRSHVLRSDARGAQARSPSASSHGLQGWLQQRAAAPRT